MNRLGESKLEFPESPSDLQPPGSGSSRMRTTDALQPNGKDGSIKELNRQGRRWIAFWICNRL